MAKYGNFEYFIEYQIWVWIKKTLTGKLVLDGLNLINCIGFKENVQKLLTTHIETHQNQLAAESSLFKNYIYVWSSSGNLGSAYA